MSAQKIIVQMKMKKKFMHGLLILNSHSKPNLLNLS